MRFLLSRHCLALLLALSYVVAPTVFAAWPGVPFAEVRAYAWPVKEEAGIGAPKVISDDGRLEPGVLNPKGALLSRPQVGRLLAEQARREKWRRSSVGCYVPHNAFVFSDSRGQTVAFIEVCFDCGAMRVCPRDKDSDPRLPVFAEIFNELGLPIGSTSVRRLKIVDRRIRAWERAPWAVGSWQRPGHEFTQMRFRDDAPEI